MRPVEGFDQLQLSETHFSAGNSIGQFTIIQNAINTRETSSRRVLEIEVNRRKWVLTIVI